MSTKSYLKFRTIRGTPQKWVGFGKPLLGPSLIMSVQNKETSLFPVGMEMGTQAARDNEAAFFRPLLSPLLDKEGETNVK